VNAGATNSHQIAAAAACLACDEPLEGNYFVSTYPPFSAWTRAALPEVHRLLQAPAAARQDEPLGLYVHVPFCVKRCDYCYYLSYADKSAADIDAYVDAVLAEAQLYRRTAALAERTPTFVYFGGGTPSLLSAREIERLLRGLQHVFPWARVQEATFECAPQSVTQAKLRRLRELGVTRISLGVQELDDDVLRLNGRVHLVRHVERAWEAIRRVGFDVVNLDLIVGLVGQTEATFSRSLDRVIGMQPECVTIYQLEIPLNTPLYRALHAGALPQAPANWDIKRARLGRGLAALEQAGYTVRSAYAAVRDPRRHRFVYQDEQYRGADLLGIGVASFSYLAGLHFQNVTALDAYLTLVRQGQFPLGRAYALTDDERLTREFVLQLKLGVADAAYFHASFGTDISQRFAEPLRELTQRGWLTVDAGGVRTTREGLLRVDRLLSAFYPAHHRGIRYT